MTHNFTKRITLVIIAIFLNFGCDQLSKQWVRKNVNVDETVSIISTYFTMFRAENTGAFLSMGDQLDGTLGKIVLVAIPLLVLLAISYYAIKDQNLNIWSILGYAFVSGGGFANLYDRILFGSVTDFLFIDFGVLHTGVFNMADVSIMVGIGMILLGQFVLKTKPSTVQ